MMKIQHSRLEFEFPEVHAEAKCIIDFQRTLRIPDDDKTYALPPGLGSFPLKAVDDVSSKVSTDIRERKGVIIPMHQSEALWISFARSAQYRQYPFAIKIAAGKRSAVTGNDWNEELQEKDYVVIPVQPWIDGFLVKSGVIRQFVAAIGGQGFTVEEQLTGKFEFGGIQLKLYPMKADEFNRRFPKPVERKSIGPIMRNYEPYSHDNFKSGGAKGMSLNTASLGPTGNIGSYGNPGPQGELFSESMARGTVVQSMGMAAGGSMKQEIHPDPYGIGVWETSVHQRCFVHLINSLAWEQVTGTKPPTAPPSAADYKKYGLPWFDWYSDAGALQGTDNSSKIKSVQQVAAGKGYTILPENNSVEVPSTTPIHAPKVEGVVHDGKW